MITSLRHILVAACLLTAHGALAAEDFPEIPRDHMTADADFSGWNSSPAQALDGKQDSGWMGTAGNWLRIDLGARFLIGRIGCNPPQEWFDGNIRDYEIYVTDAKSQRKADWGRPAARGIFPHFDYRRQIVSLKPVVGRYVILVVASTWDGRGGVNEFTAFGLGGFVPFNKITGSPWFTNSNTVSVLFDVGAGFGQPSPRGGTNRPPDADSTDRPPIAGYQITQSDAQPTEWLDAPPNEFTFAAPVADGPVTLYAWVRDSAKPPAVSKLAAVITFTRAVPTAIAKDARIATIPPDHPAVMTSSDIDDGSSDPAGMEISTSIACDGDETPGEPYVTLSKPGDYRAVLTVTNSAGTASRAECTIRANAPWATTDDLAWTGGAGPGKPEWSNPANWAHRLFPADPGGVLTFVDDGAGTVGTVTNAVDPPDGSWTVAGLTIANTECQHTTDLRGNRLIVDGSLTTGEMLVGQPVTIANGTLQAGTADRPGSIVVGYGTNYRHHVPRGLLKLSNVALDARLDRLDVGVAMTWWFVTTSVLDLREATIANGRLAADSLRVGQRAVGYVQLGPASGLRELVIARDLMIGNDGKGAVGRFGDPHNGYRLPPGVSVRVGSPEV
ncbi:MAG TPA: discoidin domain-containing protein, partial [Planctomycetota bacterium]|nr:discoidin domain-containing protein [Planctomycetota bacterium]